MRANIFKRGLEVLGSEGPRGLRQRLYRRGRKYLCYIHLLVLAFDSDPRLGAAVLGSSGIEDKHLRAMKRAFTTPLDFKRILISDEEEINGLTEIAPWKVPKAFTLDELREGSLLEVKRSNFRSGLTIDITSAA